MPIKLQWLFRGFDAVACASNLALGSALNIFLGLAVAGVHCWCEWMWLNMEKR